MEWPIVGTDLMEFIKGPDFPTSSKIMGKENIATAYQTGRGKVKVRSRAYIEELPKGRQQIVVTEIPYQENSWLYTEVKIILLKI